MKVRPLIGRRIRRRLHVNQPLTTNTDTQSYRSVNISHENKQKKSHLLTKFNNWHRRTRGKFILLNLKSIGKIVESLALKIYRKVLCL